MNFVADENIDSQIVQRLRTEGHEVFYVAECDPGIEDEAVLTHSRTLNAILITSDKDFGELVFRQRLLHTGILLLRLGGFSPEQKAAAVAKAVESHGKELAIGFSVLSESALRVRLLRDQEQ